MRKKPISVFLLLTIASGSMLYSGLSQADESASNTTDCKNVSVDYLDNPALTRAEKLARMEQALSDSLNRFELCNISISSNSSSANSGNGSGAGAGSGSGGGGGDTGNGSLAGGASGTESVASDMMQGTEQAPSNEAMAAASDTQESTESGSGKISASGSVAENGKIPEDIPPADNDDAIAAQIRVAAEAETDPEIRKKLWDEYRKYKGMNVEH
ncbi:hypothetical protein MAMP_01105 [Methylophaga aminisulfidivorans MP]|uniref:Secreted protein n=1 Tax=Methylophaga aminisulfidivorans MP TaxID=1026882 RepID=F5SZP0_9GAMM|nr:hypothetical protein [Methylophaga aminisulfidivorans]EGL54467.1 hypothetical protein MAMP_01105 [Methylophaga aminisulfidivorans MP]